MKKPLILLVLVAATGSASLMYWRRSSEPSGSYRTAPVTRGDLRITINATGTVEPQDLVDVGARVAGMIQAFGMDPDGSGKPIDFSSHVKQGTVLVQIDDALYAADVLQATAQLEQAHANVSRAEADLAQMKAKLQQAEQDWKRAQELGPSRALSATDYDAFKANYETAKATVAVGEATIVQAQKAVLQAEATLKRAEINLGYCTIRSPVDGVIVARRVNIGQTVVASLNAPSLFLIAKDLRQMQVWAAVNEADIGAIEPGQKVTFTIDTYPGQTFNGVVGKVRLNATMTQNVVTYTVEIDTDNSDGRLKPYLTANVEFEVAEHKDVLTVPNAALRWTPLPQQISPDVRHSERQDRGRRSSSPAREGETGPGEAKPATSTRGTVWVRDGAYVKPMTVRVGATDGTMTEISGDGVQEDMEVVVGEAEQRVGDDTTSPFTPRMFGNRRSSG